MKKCLSALLAALLLLSVCPAFAITLDMSYVEKHEDVYSVYLPGDGDAFVDTSNGLEISELAFEHPYEHPNQYSCICTDIIILSYGTEDAEPYLRTWIYYEGTKQIYAVSCTFIFNNKEYTFTEISDPDNMGKDDGGVYQDMVILYDLKNISFLEDLYNYVWDRVSAGEQDFSIPVILHGAETLEIEMSKSSLLDLCYMYDAFKAMGGKDFMTELNNAAPLTIR